MSDAVIGSFGTYVAPEKDNPYVPTMRAFSEAVKENPDASWIVAVSAEREQTERLAIQEAANKVGRTARLRSRDDSKREQVGTREKSGKPIYSGTVTLTFTLRDRDARGKHAKLSEPEAEVSEPVKAKK